MMKRLAATCLAASMALQCVPTLAWADNPMGYRLLSAEEAGNLPRGGGKLGLEVDRAERITNNGLTFDLLRVKAVHSGSSGEKAGFRPGDEIVAVNGRVFPSVAAFASYVGSAQPGQKISADYIPAGGGPQQAQRIQVVLGGAGRPAPEQSTGLSTGTTVAIGVGAAALFGCYKLGCFSHRGRSGAVQAQ